MKTLILLVLICGIFTINLEAQHYQTANPQHAALFQNQSNQIIGLRIDSLMVDSETILYPFATVQADSAEGCFTSNQSSWIGEKVVVKANGTNLFFNREGDTITLKTRAKVNDSWFAYQRLDTFVVEATVQNIANEKFLGLNDSVKTIAFRVMNQTGNTIEHGLNNLSVKISKNHGFVETLNFYLFPGFTVRLIDDWLEKYTLVGLTKPDVGIQNLKWFDAFDFNASDELHILEKRSGNPPFSPFVKFEKKTIFNYLERINYSDSIVYRCTRKQSIETVYSDSSSLVTNTDTIKQVVKANPAFDQLPGEPVMENDLMYAFYMRDGEFLQKINRKETQQFVYNNGCWQLVAGDGCLREMSYFDGLGGPYYSCTGYVGDTEERKLVYYKKGGNEWGEKLIITNISDFRKDNKLRVYPNPAEDKVTFQLNNGSETVNIQLFNSVGSLVKSVQFNDSSQQVDVTDFKSGIYFYKINFKGSVLYVGKLAVK